MPKSLPPIVRWHSLPLDVHRWSEHPEVHKIVKQIYNELPKETISEIESKSNNKAKASGEVHLRVLILDLFVAWKTDPTLATGVGMGNGDYKVNSRYNALHISPKIRPVVHALTELEYIDFIKHSHNSDNPTGNSTSRMRAAEKLRDLFETSKLSLNDIDLNCQRECIILTKTDPTDGGYGFTRSGKIKKNKPIPLEYDETAETTQMRSNLTLYNQQLKQTYIDIPSLEKPFVTREADGREQKIRIDQSAKFVKRTFSRECWTNNGRFYGGWWQLIPSSLRADIYINNKQTVEIDYSGLHVAILSAQKGIKIKGDKYDLGQVLIDGVDTKTQRKWVKLLVLTAINSKTEKAAFQAFRSNADTGSPEKKLNNKQLKTLLDAFKIKHPHIKNDMCSDKGIQLMYLDSQITDHIIQDFTKMGKTVLSVHDSYIVEEEFAQDLRNAMKAASLDVVGVNLEAELEGEVYESASLLDIPDDMLYDEIQKNLNLSGTCMKAYKARHQEFINNNKLP